MCGSLECILKGMNIKRPACMLLGVQTGMKKILADRMGWFPPSPRNLPLVFYRWAKCDSHHLQAGTGSGNDRWRLAWISNQNWLREEFNPQSAGTITQDTAGCI